MQFLDDRTSEALVGGGRHSSAIRQSLNLNLNINNVITVIPQVATGVAVSIFGGESGVIVGTFANLDIELG
jgi:hypothetical protein